MNKKYYHFRLYSLRYVISLIILFSGACNLKKKSQIKQQQELEEISRKEKEAELAKAIKEKEEELTKARKEKLSKESIEAKIRAELKAEEEEFRTKKELVVNEVSAIEQPTLENVSYETAMPNPIVNIDNDVDIFKNYKVGLEADSIIKIGGFCTLKVLIGPEQITLSYNQGKVHDEIIISSEIGRYAKITPHAPGFIISPPSLDCIRLDSSEIGYLFSLEPKSIGTFEVSANIKLYKDSTCSSSPTPKIAAALKVVVEVAPNSKVAEPQIKVEEATLWESIKSLFKEHLLEFIGGLFTLFFGYLLFFIRKKLKKKTGYAPEEKEA